MPAFLAEAQDLLGREYPEFDVVWFGHVGDGNLHIHVLRPEGMGGAEFVGQCEQVTQLLAATLQRHGGRISAEHGLGPAKKPYLPSPRSEAEIEVRPGIPSVLDPHRTMHPSHTFPSLT